MTLRLAAAAVVLISLAAACGDSKPVSEAPSPKHSEPVSRTPTVSQSQSQTPTASPTPTGGCRTTDVLDVGKFISVKPKPGWIPAITATGEIVVATADVPGVFNELNIIDPHSKERTLVVSRPAPESAESAKTAIADVGADADWVVWNETGFSLGEGDWAIWSMDRRSGHVAHVASNKPGPDGHALPGWITNLSVVGGTAVWAAPTPVGGKAESRVYVADLQTRTVVTLKPDANFPSMLSTGKIAALVATANGQGGLLSQPAELGINDGSELRDSWAAPARFVRAAATDRAVGLIAVTKEATADDPISEAEAIVRLGDRGPRTVSLPGEWGEVTAGEDFVAFSDASHLWLLGSSSAEPLPLVETTSTIANIHFVAQGSWLYWHADAIAGTEGHDSLLHLACGS